MRTYALTVAAYRHHDDDRWRPLRLEWCRVRATDADSAVRAEADRMWRMEGAREVVILLHRHGWSRDRVGLHVSRVIETLAVDSSGAAIARQHGHGSRRLG